MSDQPQQQPPSPQPMQYIVDTEALAIWGDVKIIIDKLPPGAQPIATRFADDLVRVILKRLLLSRLTEKDEEQFWRRYRMMERGVIRELTDNGYGHAASGFLLKMQILVMLVLTNGRGGWERELQSGMPHAPQQSIPGWQFWRRRG